MARRSQRAATANVVDAEFDRYCDALRVFYTTPPGRAMQKKVRAACKAWQEADTRRRAACAALCELSNAVQEAVRKSMVEEAQDDG